MSATEVASSLGVTAGTARKHLNALLSLGLAERVDGRWRRRHRDLDTVAKELGTAGKGEVQRLQHQIQRQGYDQYLGLTGRRVQHEVLPDDAEVMLKDGWAATPETVKSVAQSVGLDDPQPALQGLAERGWLQRKVQRKLVSRYTVYGTRARLYRLIDPEAAKPAEVGPGEAG